MGGDPQRPPKAGSDSDGNERERIVAAFARAAAEHGYAQLETGHVARYAGLGPGALEAHFDSVEQGLAAAQEEFLDGLRRDAISAAEDPDEWPLKVRAALAAVLASLAEAGAVARALGVEASAVSLAATGRQLAALERFASMLAEGRRHYPAAASLPPVTERLLVGGVASVVTARLLAEEAAALPGLERELTELLLLPYVSAAGRYQRDPG